MLSLILTFFLLHIAIHLVNTVGATTIDNLVCGHHFAHLQWGINKSVSNQPIPTRNKQLWIVYLKLPTATSRQAREQNRLRREVLELKRDMNNTSSQDEFAKWAKLRRRHDKTLEEYEAASMHCPVFFHPSKRSKGS